MMANHMHTRQHRPSSGRSRRAAPLAMVPILALALCISAQAQAQFLPPPPVSPAPVLALEYDANGNFTKATQAGLATSHRFDSLNRRWKSTDARAKDTLFVYTGRDDLSQVTDPRSLVTQYLRNGLGDATALSSPDTGTQTFTLDAAGNLLTRTDARGVLASYAYDALNRLFSITYSLPGQASQAFGWSYDQSGAGFSYGIGRLTSTQFPQGSASYAYDAQGRLVSTTQAVVSQSTTALTTGYGYDAAGHVTSITYPSGRVLYIQHAGGVATGISLAPDGSALAVPLISALQLEPSPGAAGAARSWLWHLDAGTQPNTRAFDIYGRMVRYPLGGAVRDLTYDAADRISHYTHLDAGTGTATAAAQALNQSFGYDELGQITGIGTSVGNWSIAYDDNGNRTAVAYAAATGSGTRNYNTAADSNRLLALDNPVRTLAQDAAGNTVSDLQSGLGWTAQHDLSGRVVSLTSSPDGSNIYVTQYAYDAHGRRVLITPVSASCVGSRNTCSASFAGRRSRVVFVYDQQGMLLGEYLADGTPLREYIWLQGMPLAVIDGSPASPAIYYVQADHLDTPRVVIDRQGRQRWTWLAEPFGNSAPVTNPLGFGMVNLNLRMPGQYFDSESGLSYNYFRNYDAGVGRFTQSDPIGLAGGLNTYAYVGGNPLSFTDPQGLAPGDKWYGFNDREFQRWFHQCWKQRGDPDANKEGLAEAYAVWVNRGKPTGGRCGNDPPPPPPPVPSGDTCGDDCKKVATTVVVGGTAYIVYRCLRMVPSLFPPLWPTIPGNLVVP